MSVRWSKSERDKTVGRVSTLGWSAINYQVAPSTHSFGSGLVTFIIIIIMCHLLMTE